jgi:small subunit ribosomal protein S7
MKQKKFYLYNKFVGFITKNGKKPKAKIIFDSALHSVIQKSKIPLNKILLIIFLKLNSYIEIKTIRIRKKIHFVPFPTNYKRRIYLVTKWLIHAALEDKRKLPFSKKLSLEIFNLIKNKSSKSLKSKENNFFKATTNRSNLHFRW